jgi:hypothetical protein
MEDYKDIMDDIKRLSAEEALGEVTTSVTTEGDVCDHGNSYASNCSDCDEEVIKDSEHLEWYDNWKKENFKK